MRIIFISLFSFFAFNVQASSDMLKIAHMGIPNHDAVIRHLTNNEATIISKPGAKGLIIFQALENKEVDFIITTSSPLYITDPSVFGFDPKKKFKILGPIAEANSSIYLSPNFKSIEDLKNKKGEILHASGGDEAEKFIDSLFTKNKVVHVPYKGIGQQLVDVKQGIADFTFLAESTIIAFGGAPIKTDFTFKIHLLTRQDIDQDKISKLVSIMKENSKSERAIEFFNKSKTKFIPLKGN